MADQRPIIKGQGALSNASGRYELHKRHDVDDGWNFDNTPSHSDGNVNTRTETVNTIDVSRQAVEAGPSVTKSAHGVRTYAHSSRPVRWYDDRSKSVITHNRSPDVPFNRSINPYRGCEHGCIYCFARPTHTWLGHSAGVDFERLLYAKRDAARLLKQSLSRPGYQCEPMAIGVNTDAYQPLEKTLRITRSILQIMVDFRHPVYLITKSSLIERDLDLLSELAIHNLVSVTVTVTTLDNTLASRLEPRATAPHRRLRTLERLSNAGIQTRASISPIIPALNEHEIDSLVNAVAQAGASEAHCILLRLPHELQTLFPEWLHAHYPLKAARVLKAIASVRDGQLNDSGFGSRMTGEGPRASIIHQRFRNACKRAGLSSARTIGQLNTSLFRVPGASEQLRFDL